MRALAAAHRDTGWHAHAFPLSVVDGVEIVASLVLLADRRTGRRSGWLPWTALAIGTAASLAANVATAGPDPISRIIAGWPALALLIAVKLLTGILEHRPAAVQDPATDAEGDGPGDEVRQRARQTVPVLPRPTGTADNASHREFGRLPARDGGLSRPARANSRSQQATSPGRTVAVPAGRPAPPAHPRRTGTWPGTVPGTAADIAALLPAARAAWDGLYRDGHPRTRDALAARLRHDGHPVRNARLTPLLQALRDESTSPSTKPALEPSSGPPRPA